MLKISKTDQKGNSIVKKAFLWSWRFNGCRKEWNSIRIRIKM